MMEQLVRQDLELQEQLELEPLEHLALVVLVETWELQELLALAESPALPPHKELQGLQALLVALQELLVQAELLVLLDCKGQLDFVGLLD
jgi:hypothetical protein